MITLRSGLGLLTSIAFSSIGFSTPFPFQLSEQPVAFISPRLHDINAVAVGLKSGAEAAARLPAYFHRLSIGAQRTYLKSDSIGQYDFVASPAAREMAQTLVVALEEGVPSIVERRAQGLLDELCRSAMLPGVRLQVRS